MPDKINAVRIMCDWCADGVWSARIPNSSMAGFRVSQTLWYRIQRWQDWYHQHDALLDVTDDPNFDLASFAAEGAAIAVAMKVELPDWIVLYVDESLRHYDDRACWTIEVPFRLN